MATLAQLQAEREQIAQAIEKILVAQEYQEGATRVKKANLDTLYQRLDTLDSRIYRLDKSAILRPVFGDAK